MGQLSELLKSETETLFKEIHMSANSIEIALLHHRAAKPLGKINRVPTVASDGSMTVNYKGRKFSVLNLDGKSVLYVNRPLGSEYKQREAVAA